uniref:Cytotoxic and regulatory T cell molecule n=1 Tax=Pelodiscus sinensis TaxID=13735 RepID=K7F3F3_PELSI
VTTKLCARIHQFLLAGDFQEVHTETVTVEEGQDLSLPCAFPRGHEFALEWVNPRGFIIFLNNNRGLKDERYKLIHYSKNKLSISLSKVTIQDEGTYKCNCYDRTVKTKEVNVIVLAAPSKPVLEVSEIRTDGEEEKIVLSCLTWGSKPPPQITWLLDNGLEVYGDTKHKFEHDGKKCNTTSTLTVRAYNQDSTASCVIHHETVQEGKLTASFQFKHFMTTSSSAPNMLEISTKTSENPQHYVERTLNITEETSFTDTPTISNEQSTQNSTIITETDLNSEGIRQRETSVLLPVLVAVLIFVMLIIVLLFMRKLKKAHGVWKRENDTSEQTLESYKSRSNEDNQAVEKNGQVANTKPNMQYVTEGYAETVKRNSEERDVSAFEKHLVCGKETDV